MIGVEMGWRQLLFANWPVEPEVVERGLPEGLEVDTYDGKAWLSVVPFTNVAVRPRGLPDSIGVDLPELNLRTYVTVPGEDRPAVFFYSLDADGWLSVLGARLAFGLPYYNADIKMVERDGAIRYRSRRAHPGDQPLRFDARYEPTGDRLDAEPGSLAEFLTERYRFYVGGPGGTIAYANVDHDVWSLRPATVEFRKNEIFRTNNFAEPDGEPICYYSSGVDIVSSGRKWLK